MPVGWISIILIVFINIFAARPIRYSKHYNVSNGAMLLKGFYLKHVSIKFKVFFAIHRLYIVVIVLIMLHCRNFWKWIIGPLILLTIEYIKRIHTGVSSTYGSTIIKDVYFLPSNVVQLVIQRPEKFKFQAGDYVLINIPVFSRYEYHPFTISSCPENKGEVN